MLFKGYFTINPTIIYKDIKGVEYSIKRVRIDGEFKIEIKRGWFLVIIPAVKNHRAQPRPPPPPSLRATTAALLLLHCHRLGPRDSSFALLFSLQVRRLLEQKAETLCRFIYFGQRFYLFILITLFLDFIFVWAVTIFLRQCVLGRDHFFWGFSSNTYT